ncbi:unnamed protein product, partial [Amoebophrya sp. A120]
EVVPGSSSCPAASPSTAGGGAPPVSPSSSPTATHSPAKKCETFLNELKEAQNMRRSKRKGKDLTTACEKIFKLFDVKTEEEQRKWFLHGVLPAIPDFDIFTQTWVDERKGTTSAMGNNFHIPSSTNSGGGVLGQNYSRVAGRSTHALLEEAFRKISGDCDCF